MTPVQRIYQQAMDTVALTVEDPRAALGVIWENRDSALRRRKAIKIRYTKHTRY